MNEVVVYAVKLHVFCEYCGVTEDLEGTRLPPLLAALIEKGWALTQYDSFCPVHAPLAVNDRLKYVEKWSDD